MEPTAEKSRCEPVTAKVRCQGSLHTIRLDEVGRLHFDDHASVADLAAAGTAAEWAQASGCIRCAQVLLAWRRAATELLPKPLVEIRREMALRAVRKAWRQAPTPPLVPLRERAEAYLRQAVRKALRRASYRESQSHWAGGQHEVEVRVGRPAADGGSNRVWSSNGKWSGNNSWIKVTVPFSWRRRVERQDIAVVDGCLVLDVAAETADGLYVWAVRQGRGFSVRVDRALITRGESYVHLHWISRAKWEKKVCRSS